MKRRAKKEKMINTDRVIPFPIELFYDEEQTEKMFKKLEETKKMIKNEIKEEK